MKSFIIKTAKIFSKLKSALEDFPLLFMRLTLAYGFYVPAKMKINNINDIASWFESLGIPLPGFNAYLAAGTEAFGVVLLTLGLGTRIITLPLMITMAVAIFTVHYQNGFNAGDNGFEIPLYYLIMLFTLFVFGPGRLSLDFLIRKKVDSTIQLSSN